jgi:hypothetical protein
MKEFTVMLNSQADLTELAERIGNSGINILTLSMDSDGEKGATVHLVTSDDTSCREVLRQGRYSFKEEEIITVTIDDKPGSLARLLMKLKRVAVGVRSIYIINKKDGKAEFVMNLDNMKEGKKLLFEKLGLEP